MENFLIKNTYKLIWIGFVFLVMITLQFSIDYYTEKKAPTSYYIDVEEIHVSDMTYGEWEQDIRITRNPRTNVFGYVYQELYAYTHDPDEPAIKLYQTKRNNEDNPILFEISETGDAYYSRNWLSKIPKDKLEKLEVGKEYFFIWVIEFDINEYRRERNMDIINVQTNNFKVLPPRKFNDLEINIELD